MTDVTNIITPNVAQQVVDISQKKMQADMAESYWNGFINGELDMAYQIIFGIAAGFLIGSILLTFMKPSWLYNKKGEILSKEENKLIPWYTYDLLWVLVVVGYIFSRQM